MKFHTTSIALLLAFLPLSYTQSVVVPSPSAPAVPSAVAPSSSAAVTTPAPPSNTPIPPSDIPSSDVPPPSITPSVSVPPSSTPSDVGSITTTLPPPGSVNTSITSTPMSSMRNASMTSSSLAPNATAISNSTANATAPELTADESDGWLGSAGDATPPPADFQADEQVVNLVYAANYDKAECLSLAQSYASGSTPKLRRHWAEVAYKRKRQQLPLKCLPAAYTIPVTIHWFPPKGVDRSKWVNTNSLTKTILATQNKLGIMNAAMDIRDRWVWPANDNTERFTMNVEKNMDWAIGYIKSIREKMGTNKYDHLNIFLVQSAGDGLNGFANFPGTSARSDYPDAVVLSVHTLLGNKYGTYDATKKPYHGTTMAHEIGHWLGLFHPHQGGCSGTDYDSVTPQYPEGWGDYTCQNKYVGVKGSEEHNLMAYSYGRTIDQGTFARGQARRAAAGWAIRRSGMKTAKINDGKYYTDKCVNKYRRRDIDTNSTEIEIERSWDSILVPRQLPSLSKRQLSSQLSSFCDSPDLTIPNYQFSTIAQTGLYNADSPSIPGAPAVAQVQSIDPGSQAVETGGEKSNNFGAVQAQVKQRVEQSGGAIVDGKAAAVPAEVKQELDAARTSTGSGGTSGISGSTKSAAGRKLQAGAGAAVGLVLAGLMGLMVV